MNPHRTKPALAYLSIAALAIVAWLPISAMIFSVKNDVLSFEYPIQFFISENLRKGNFPLWMDSWALGFPLQSVLTWGVYSTPRFLIGLIFGSSLYALHIEFILYSIASGCIMYKLLKTHFTGNKELANKSKVGQVSVATGICKIKTEVESGHYQHDKGHVL